ncbi:MAG: hypothetical protein COB67_02505 [SAR324 cluster bacterium]|uniref:Uncharacterized protein n=1 Tax=SAR324 cluster bacterium TaxID=2024889 RepID=A0A2A4T966_9DELT|nr:MAG: hypothetical protein COB67_02505 [SAR324 cluster bacterium]
MDIKEEELNNLLITFMGFNDSFIRQMYKTYGSNAKAVLQGIINNAKNKEIFLNELQIFVNHHWEEKDENIKDYIKFLENEKKEKILKFNKQFEHENLESLINENNEDPQMS